MGAVEALVPFELGIGRPAMVDFGSEDLGEGEDLDSSRDIEKVWPSNKIVTVSVSKSNSLTSKFSKVASFKAIHSPWFDFLLNKQKKGSPLSRKYPRNSISREMFT